MLDLLTRSPFARGKVLLLCTGLISLMGCSKGDTATLVPDSVVPDSMAPDGVVLGNATPQPEEAAASPQREEAPATPQIQENTTFASTSTKPTATAQPSATGQPAATGQPTSTARLAQSLSKQSEDSDSDVFVFLRAGMQYADARNRLMRQGWIPATLPAPGPYGVERMAHEAGFTEVSACAGTGLGQCRFEFRHDSANKILSVITVGGAALEVSDWSISTPVEGTPTVPTSNPADIAAVPAPVVIPAAFQGEWNANIAECGISDPSTGRLIVQLDNLRFWETTSSVQQVNQRGEREITVTSEAYGEGETFTQTKTLRRSKDDFSLTDVDTNTVWYSCFAISVGSPAIETIPNNPSSNNPPIKSIELDEIPEPFHGVWNSSREQCDAPYSDGRLTITADRYQFWETTGTVNTVTVTGELEITVTATKSSEGSSYEDTITFGISDDASLITHGDGFVKFKCPSN